MNNLSFTMQLSASRYLSFYFVIMHLALVSIVFIFAVSTPITQLIVVTVVVHWAYCRWRYTDDTGPYWVSRVLYNHENWSLTVNNELIAVTLMQATVWSRLVVMGFKGENPSRNYTVLVFPDSANTELRRQLRVIIANLPIWKSQ
ncbi:MAG: hypothetical protein ACI89U_000149 [Gammaproteobacteria bacterium]|jgi:hypothetical protein